MNRIIDVDKLDETIDEFIDKDVLPTLMEDLELPQESIDKARKILFTTIAHDAYFRKLINIDKAYSGRKSDLTFSLSEKVKNAIIHRSEKEMELFEDTFSDDIDLPALKLSDKSFSR